MTAQRYRPADGLLATELEHELVLLDPQGSQMYSLNGSGRLLWNALPATADELANTLVREYGLDAARAHADAAAWLGEMGARRLVLPE